MKNILMVIIESTDKDDHNDANDGDNDKGGGNWNQR